MRRFTIYYEQLGGHIHCRVYINGGKSGELVIAEEEWPDFVASFRPDTVAILPEER